MRVIRNTGQNVSPSDDGRLYDQAFTDGLFNSPSITSLGANLVQIGSMYGILCGRDFTADAQQINVELPSADTATGYIYIKYDTATDDIISVESALAPFTVTYEDINTSGTVCEMIIATYTASQVAVTSLTANYPTAQTEVNETLAGSIATVETSPATANHSVGEYIVYNGQLYKVTSAITAGTTLNGKISAESVMDLNVVTITNNGLDFKYAKFGRLVLVDISGVPTTTSQFTTSGFPTAMVGNHMTTPQWGAIANQVQIWIDDNASVINMRYQQATNLRATLIYVS